MANEIGLYKDPRRQKPWVVRWFGEYDPASGKRKFYSKSFRTKADAENFKSEQHHDFNNGLSRDKAQAVALGSFCRDYLNTRKSELQPASLELYEQTAKRLKNYFGKDRTVSEITPKDAAMFISKQVNMALGKEGESLSDWSIEQIKRHCNRCNI